MIPHLVSPYVSHSESKPLASAQQRVSSRCIQPEYPVWTADGIGSDVTVQKEIAAVRADGINAAKVETCPHRGAIVSTPSNSSLQIHRSLLAAPVESGPKPVGCASEAPTASPPSPPPVLRPVPATTEITPLAAETLSSAARPLTEKLTLPCASKAMLFGSTNWAEAAGWPLPANMAPFPA